jgi:hypothetical protein
MIIFLFLIWIPKPLTQGEKWIFETEFNKIIQTLVLYEEDKGVFLTYDSFLPSISPS